MFSWNPFFRNPWVFDRWTSVNVRTAFHRFATCFVRRPSAVFFARMFYAIFTPYNQKIGCVFETGLCLFFTLSKTCIFWRHQSPAVLWKQSKTTTLRQSAGICLFSRCKKCSFCKKYGVKKWTQPPQNSCFTHQCLEYEALLVVYNSFTRCLLLESWT